MQPRRERADRSDKRDERGELETTICSGHILPPYLFVILRKKKVKIKLEELMEPVNREENCLLTV